jgi:hypothetical protein
VFLYPNQGFYLRTWCKTIRSCANRSLRMAGRGPVADAKFLQESGLRATLVSSTPKGRSGSSRDANDVEAEAAAMTTRTPMPVYEPMAP